MKTQETSPLYPALRRGTAALAGALLCTGAMAGEVVYDNGGPDQQSGYVATFAWVADDFVLPVDATISAMEFWFIVRVPGNSWDGNVQYAIFNDASGMPGVLPISSGPAENITSEFIQGFTLGSSSYHEYRVTFDLQHSVSLVAGPTYWIALHLAQDGLYDYENVAWETTNQVTGAVSHYSADGHFNNWTSPPGAKSVAFNLQGPEAVVPLPVAVTFTGPRAGTVAVPSETGFTYALRRDTSLKGPGTIVSEQSGNGSTLSFPFDDSAGSSRRAFFWIEKRPE